MMQGWKKVLISTGAFSPWGGDHFLKNNVLAMVLVRKWVIMGRNGPKTHFRTNFVWLDPKKVDFFRFLAIFDPPKVKKINY